MNKEIGTRIRDKILPLFVFPAVVGIMTGVLVFVFRIASSFVMNKSAQVYAFVRENPIYIPLLLFGAAAIGALSSLLLSFAKESRGGGIPTAVASIRGLIPMKWVQGIFALFGSSMLTYIAGVPLGNEGPSVQMGAAMGKGASGLFGKRNRAWERYNMTGGACAGFAIATGAPLAGVVFAMEEAHRRFSPTIFIVAATSVISGTVTSELLSSFFGVDTTFFDLEISEALPIKHMWIAIVIGVLCGICANLLTKLYHYVRKTAKNASHKIPFFVNIIIIFILVAILGFVSGDFVGSGHTLIEKIFEGRGVWYMILVALIIRSVVMILANTGGVSGGLFVPTLAIGAMIASLIADSFIALGIADGQYYTIFIVVGMASFLSSSSRIPLTALAFSLEALSVTNNILPVILGVVAAYVVAEVTGGSSFADTVIDAKTSDARAGKQPVIVDAHMRVQPNAFAIGMEIRDVLWPPTCTVLSVDREIVRSGHHSAEITEGDVLHLHYQTYDKDETLELLTRILGEQPGDETALIREGREARMVPRD